MTQILFPCERFLRVKRKKKGLIKEMATSCAKSLNKLKEVQKIAVLRKNKVDER